VTDNTRAMFLSPGIAHRRVFMQRIIRYVSDYFLLLYTVDVHAVAEIAIWETLEQDKKTRKCLGIMK
jgi:hypothetical protein